MNLSEIDSPKGPIKCAYHVTPISKYRLLHAFECNTDIISRVNGEVISRGEAECNLAISE